MQKTPGPERGKNKSVNAAGHSSAALPTSVWFLIVGIGASAGGLDALEQFLRHLPAGNGMAFVIVQHLDPTHKGILPELLQRATGTLADITASKTLEAKLRNQQAGPGKRVMEQSAKLAKVRKRAP